MNEDRKEEEDTTAANGNEEKASDDDENQDDDEDESEPPENNEQQQQQDAYKLAAVAEFEEQCKSLQENDAKFAIFNAQLMLDDEKAIQLGRALVGNTHLYMLCIMMGRDLTDRGVRALLGGMQGCNPPIRYPVILRGGDNEMPPMAPVDNELAQMYLQPMKTAERLLLAFPMDDDNAIWLGHALDGNQTITSLSMQVQQMSPLGARAVAEGIRGVTNLKLLHFGVRPNTTVSSETMQTLYQQGLEGLSTLEELEFVGILVDMRALMAALPTLPLLRALSLTEVDVSDDSYAALLGEALSQNQQLTQLVLHVGHMTLSSAAALWAALSDDNNSSMNSIHNLEFAVATPTEQPSALIMKSFYQQGIRGFPQLQELTVSNFVGDIHGLVPALPLTLCQLSITLVELTVAEVEILCQDLMKATSVTLHTLCITECALQDDHMCILSSILCTHPTITTIDLSQNWIGNIGVASIIRVWKSSLPRQRWIFAGNPNILG